MKQLFFIRLLTFQSKAINKACFYLLLLLSPFASHAQTFHQKTGFPGGQRWFGLSFAIGNNVYVAAGNDSSNAVGYWVNTAMKNDLWQYNTATDVWTQKSNLPFSPRSHAAAITLNGTAYVGLGYDSSLSSVSDWWKYNEAADTWTKMNDFPGGDRYSATAFSWNGKGYIIGGQSFQFSDTSIHRVYDDFWEYNPATDAWTQLGSFPGGERSDCFGITIGDTLYIGMGENDSLGVYYDNIYKCYLPTKTWSAMASVPGTANVPAVNGVVSFCAAAGNKIMLMNIDIDYTIATDLKTVYIYNVANNTWSLHALGNTPGWRLGNFCTQIGNKAYMGAGSDYYNWAWPEDFWEVDLQNFITSVENALPDIALINVYASAHIIGVSMPESILQKGNAELELYDMEGKQLHKYYLNAENRFDTNELPSGSYAYRVIGNNSCLKSGIISLR